MEVIDLAKLPEAPLPSTEGEVTRRFFSGEQMTVARISFSKGARLAAHKHVNEQFSFLLSGRVEFVIEGAVRMVGPGEMVHLPSQVTHEARALEESVVLDMFAPPRTEWHAR